MSELTKFYLRVNPLTDVAYMASEGTPKVGTPRYYLAADVERVFADHAARVAELEQQVAERANWICPETYALTLQAVAIEAEAKDRAERLHADYLACEIPPSGSDTEAMEKLPRWAGEWIRKLKAGSSGHFDQAMANGRSAAIERERADRAERRLGEAIGLLRECYELSKNWPGIAYSDDLSQRISNATQEKPA